MANRQYPNDAKSTAKTRIYIDFSWMGLVSAGTVDPKTFRGRGVKSVTCTTAGQYFITLEDAFRNITTKNADIEETGFPGDGSYATITTPANEGGPSPITFGVVTRAASGTVTGFANRRVSVNIVCNNSSVDP